MSPLQALVWEEWARVRRWCPWVWAALAVYVLLLAMIEPHLHNDKLVWASRAVNGFEALERTDRTPRELFLMVIVLAGAMLLGVISAYDTSRGLSLGVPGRYLVMPLHAARTYLLQAAARFALALPLAALLAWCTHVLALESDIPTRVWVAGAVVGVAGPMASAAWNQKLGGLGVFIWIALPTGLWILGLFDYALDGSTPFTLPAVIVAVVGLGSGAGLLGAGGALEPFPAPRFLSRASRRGRGSISGFRTSGAALRWAERPRYLVYSIPVDAAIATAVTFYVARTEVPMILRMHWLPWTPEGIPDLALAQALLARWGHFGALLLPWAVAAAGCLEGIVFLRRHVLLSPFQLRLPVSTRGLAKQTVLAVMGEAARTCALGALLFGGANFVASEPNVGAQYVWPNDNSNRIDLLDGAYTLRGGRGGMLYNVALGVNDEMTPPWFDDPVPRLDLAEAVVGFTALLLGSFLFLWGAFWQVLWGVVPLCWETGLEHVFLMFFFCAMSVRALRAGKRARAAVALMAALAAGTNEMLWMSVAPYDGDAFVLPVCGLVGLCTVLWLLARRRLGEEGRRRAAEALAVVLLASACAVAGVVVGYQLAHIGLVQLAYYRGTLTPTRFFSMWAAVLLAPYVAINTVVQFRRHR